MELSKIEALCELANVELDLMALNAINRLNLRDDFDEPAYSEADSDLISTNTLDKVETIGARYERAKKIGSELEIGRSILADIEPLINSMPVLYISAFTQGSINFYSKES